MSRGPVPVSFLQIHPFLPKFVDMDSNMILSFMLMLAFLSKASIIPLGESSHQRILKQNSASISSNVIADTFGVDGLPQFAVATTY